MHINTFIPTCTHVHGYALRIYVYACTCTGKNGVCMHVITDAYKYMDRGWCVAFVRGLGACVVEEWLTWERQRTCVCVCVWMGACVVELTAVAG